MKMEAKFSALVSIILAGCQLSSVVGVQRFLEEPSSLISAPGGDVTFSCLVVNKGGECRWQKDGKPVGMYPGKYTLSEAEGDCSLTVHDVDIRLDDGHWQCQVTGTTFTSQDALASSTARLTVEIAPESVNIQYEHITVTTGELSVKEGVVEKVTCVTRQSNPAPAVAWFLGDTKLSSVEQINVTERQMKDRWRSEATLSHKFGIQDSGKQLKCIVTHAGYGVIGSSEVSVVVMVMYRPIVTIAREDTSDQLLEGVDSVKMVCSVNSHPASAVSWSRLDTRTGSHTTVQTGPELKLSPVMRENDGTYICKARNTVGESDPGQTVVTVLHPPGNVETTPAGVITVAVHNTTRLECRAEGKPRPKFQWVQGGKVRSYTQYLDLESVGYADHGDYHCLATNVLQGERHEASSESVRVKVSGPPQVVRQSSGVIGLDGGDVRLEAEVCSDPSPSQTSWTWGEVVLASGEEMEGGRYRADLVSHPKLEHCYISRLTVRGVGHRDTRSYHVSVTNMHGTDTAPVHLTVRAPVPLTSAITGASLLAVSLILLVCTCLVCRTRRKLCFKGSAEKEVAASQNSFSNKAESRVSLVNETKDKPVPVSPVKINPHSTKV